MPDMRLDKCVAGSFDKKVTTEGFEPSPFRTSA